MHCAELYRLDRGLSYKKVRLKRSLKRSKVRLPQLYFYVSNIENFQNVEKFVP